MDSFLEFNYNRRFGVEIEINAFDKAVNRSIADPPKGIREVAFFVLEVTGETTKISEWGPTHWLQNDQILHENKTGCWIVKPDGSCGMEICTPILKGWLGLKKVCEVIDAISQKNIPLRSSYIKETQSYYRIMADDRCSIHVHIDIADCNVIERERIIKHWIKVEHILVNCLPKCRKDNKYCKLISLHDWFHFDSKIGYEELIKKLGESKYLTLNTYHLLNGDRQSLEFRLGDSVICKNSFFAKNWIRLLLHFVECAKRKEVVDFKWVNLQDLLSLLCFDDKHNLSGGMEQVKSWFLARLLFNIHADKEGALCSNTKKILLKQLMEILDEKWVAGAVHRLYPFNKKEVVYGDSFIK